MTTSNTTFGEAYVIESDGSRTAIPIGFADGKGPGASSARREPFRTRRVSYATGPRVAANSAGYQPQQPGPGTNASRVKERFRLHLGRRIFGLALTIIGLPLLILPGPGLLLILVGLSLVFSR